MHDRPPGRRRTVTTIVLFIALALLLYPLYLWWATRLPSTETGWIAGVETVAGGGTPGFADGTGETVRFADPFGLAVGPLGVVYVSDGGGNNRIRRLDATGVVSTVAGGAEGFADGVGSAAAFNTPSGLAVDEAGNLYIADTGNHAIRRMTPGGVVTTIAGDGVPGHADGWGRAARFNGPVGIAVAPGGLVFVADSYNDRIRRIDPDGQVTTVAGGDTPGYRDGAAEESRFDTPCDLVVMPSGDLVVADTGNSVLRVVDTTGMVRTLGADGPSGLVVITSAGLAVTHDGFLYVTGYRDGRIVQVTPGGESHEIAGAVRGFADGDGALAQFREPSGIVVDRRGHLFVADAGNYLVRRLRPAGQPLAPTAFAAAPLGDEPVPRMPAALFEEETFLWPLDPQTWSHEITGTLGEARATGSDRRARLHGGLDIHGPLGSIVRAVRDEKVRSPIAVSGVGGENEGLAVDLVSYVHVRIGRSAQNSPLDGTPFLTTVNEAGRVVRVRVRRGERFRVGEPLGTINRLFHVHLEIGPPGAQINPLSLAFVDLVDTTPPVIVRDGVRLFDAEGRRLTTRRGGRLVVAGQVRITVEAYDRVDQNVPRRRLGLYRAGYQVLHADGTPAPGFEEPRITIEFDRLPPDSYAGPFAYAEQSGIAAQGHPLTRFLYVVTNIVRDGRAEEGVWDTTTLPAGDYILRVLAADHHGNVAELGRDVAMTLADAPEVSAPLRHDGS